MIIRKQRDIPSSEITPERTYRSRRSFLQGAALAGSAAASGFLYRALVGSPPPPQPGPSAPILAAPRTVHLEGEAITSLDDITQYNNFYEFSTDKRGVAPEALGFVTTPWAVTVTGLVHEPKTYDLDDLRRLAPPEERVYRMRCVEGWSMVIPWIGFPLAALLADVAPLSTARYVAFETLYDPNRMPNQDRDVLPWPYVEGLRLDEAMHPLTLLATGLYGRELPPQNGAPVRLVVPWKYGFKSIKSIVTIRLVASMPPATWNQVTPAEYGFFSNVNPSVSHPRWSQARERRIGEYGTRPTLPFNGYGDQVAHLYAGMDLRKYF